MGMVVEYPLLQEFWLGLDWWAGVLSEDSENLNEFR